MKLKQSILILFYILLLTGCSKDTKVMGVVVDEAGNPIEGVRYCISGYSNLSGTQQLRSGFTSYQFTDKEGRFSLSPSEYLIDLQFEGGNHAPTFIYKVKPSVNTLRGIAPFPPKSSPCGRQLQYHPHIHYIVPGGGIDRKTKLWKKSSSDFLVNVKALSKLFKGKLKELLKKEGLLEKVDPYVWFKKFNVNAQALKHNNEGAVKYLAPYVFKIAISDSRIISCYNRKVTFSYTKKGSRRKRKITIDVMEFMRRYLQHVLPDGFMKVRYYGFMSPNCKIPAAEICTMVELAYNFEIRLIPKKEKMIFPIVQCCKCGKEMRLTQSIFSFELSTA